VVFNTINVAIEIYAFITISFERGQFHDPCKRPAPNDVEIVSLITVDVYVNSHP
jgi:hypothetical protein